VAKKIYQWLNFEWNRSMKGTADFIENPFIPEKMMLVAPKGACACLAY
jgi:hypothetical protein